LSGQDAAIVSSPDAAQIFTICAPRTPARAERFATTPAILLAACAITHRTSPKAELFCKICMMDRAAAMIARHAMDAYYCWLFRESLMQLEGELRERRICRSPFF